MRGQGSLSETCDGLEDMVGGFGPLEWLGVVVVSIEVVLNSCTKLRDIGMGASSQCVFGEESEEAFYHIHPRGMRGCEVKMKAGAFA